MLKCFNLNLNATCFKGSAVSEEVEKGDTKERLLIEICFLKINVKAHLASVQWTSGGLQRESRRTGRSEAHKSSWWLPWA